MGAKHDVIYSTRIGRTWLGRWLWVAVVYQGDYEGEGSGIAWTRRRAERQRDDWIRSMGAEP